MYHITLIILREQLEDHLSETCITFSILGILFYEDQDTIACIKIEFEIILEEIFFLELEINQPLFQTLIKVLQQTRMMQL